ncbi:MAG: 16S rRNA (cytosine(1402)-N(4))-methyltransferase, partial [Gammaproteobacteria bacterium]|nr:16S rRNA (cytosine(1402)-N(4))-methyltransferase [Gammaproteobacteria bacterium]
VKRFMREQASVPEPYRGLPEIPTEVQPSVKTVGKVIKATAAEVEMNPRARSARLRTAERLASDVAAVA